MIPPPTAKQLCIGHLAVRENQRRKGVASKLIEFVEKQLIVPSVHQLVLDVATSNQVAIEFYLSLDFEKHKLLTSAEAQSLGFQTHWRLQKLL